MVKKIVKISLFAESMRKERKYQSHQTSTYCRYHDLLWTIRSIRCKWWFRDDSHFIALEKTWIFTSANRQLLVRHAREVISGQSTTTAHVIRSMPRVEPIWDISGKSYETCQIIKPQVPRTSLGLERSSERRTVWDWWKQKAQSQIVVPNWQPMFCLR